MIRALRQVSRLPQLALIAGLRAWQVVVSPTYGATCRFYPSCSSYALIAVERYGAVRGCWLAVRRLARCHPWNPGGVDLVPDRESSGGEPRMSPTHCEGGPAHRHAA